MQKQTGVYLVWILVIVLVVIHQDIWFWEDKTLVFGFIPIGLFYHACISIAAACTWFIATKVAWPEDVEVDDQDSSEGAAS